MKLTLEEAKLFRDFLEQICVSYYEVEVRSALKKTIIYLDDLVEEMTIYVEEEIISEDDAVALDEIFEDVEE